jgi:hypothetical protein
MLTLDMGLILDGVRRSLIECVSPSRLHDFLEWLVDATSQARDEPLPRSLGYSFSDALITQAMHCFVRRIHISLNAATMAATSPRTLPLRRALMECNSLTTLHPRCSKGSIQSPFVLAGLNEKGGRRVKRLKGGLACLVAETLVSTVALSRASADGRAGSASAQDLAGRFTCGDTIQQCMG